jgi:hypothetical protein
MLGLAFDSKRDLSLVTANDLLDLFGEWLFAAASSETADPLGGATV